MWARIFLSVTFIVVGITAQAQDFRKIAADARKEFEFCDGWQPKNPRNCRIVLGQLAAFADQADEIERERNAAAYEKKFEIVREKELELSVARKRVIAKMRDWIDILDAIQKR